MSLCTFHGAQRLEILIKAADSAMKPLRMFPDGFIALLVIVLQENNAFASTCTSKPFSQSTPESLRKLATRVNAGVDLGREESPQQAPVFGGDVACLWLRPVHQRRRVNFPSVPV